MSNYTEQRNCIKFCQRNEIWVPVSKIFRIIKKACVNHHLCQWNVCKWRKQFQKHRESVEDEERDRRPSASTEEQHVKKIEELLFFSRWLTDWDLANAVGISKGSVDTILKDIFGLKSVKSRLVPKQLKFFEKKDTLRSVKRCFLTFNRWCNGDEASGN